MQVLDGECYNVGRDPGTFIDLLSSDSLLKVDRSYNMQLATRKVTLTPAPPRVNSFVHDNTGRTGIMCYTQRRKTSYPHTSGFLFLINTIICFVFYSSHIFGLKKRDLPAK